MVHKARIILSSLPSILEHTLPPVTLALQLIKELGTLSYRLFLPI
jgi:hypothetical protein